MLGIMLIVKISTIQLKQRYDDKIKDIKTLFFLFRRFINNCVIVGAIHREPVQRAISLISNVNNFRLPTSSIQALQYEDYFNFYFFKNVSTLQCEMFCCVSLVLVSYSWI